LADDEDGLLIPKTVNSGKIIRNIDEDTGLSRYDFQYSNRRGYKTTIEGLSYKFNPEYWNYAKLISGVLRYGMPIDQVIKLVGGLQLNSETINNWKNGVERALKKYIPNGAEAKEVVCEKCGRKVERHEDYSVNKIVTMSKATYGMKLCWDCAMAMKEGNADEG
jgi:ribonucleoside-diphosphate reductase alpha chain